MEERVCRKCSVSKLATEEFFPVTGGYLGRVCRKCRAATNRAYRKKNAAMLNYKRRKHKPVMIG